MKKGLNLTIFGMLSLVLLLSFGSSLTITGDSSIDLKLGTNTFTLNTGELANFSFPNTIKINGDKGSEMNIAFSSANDKNNISKINITATLSGDFIFEESGSVDVNFTAVNVDDKNDNNTKTISFNYEETEKNFEFDSGSDSGTIYLERGTNEIYLELKEGLGDFNLLDDFNLTDSSENIIEIKVTNPNVVGVNNVTYTLEVSGEEFELGESKEEILTFTVKDSETSEDDLIRNITVVYRNIDYNNFCNGIGNPAGIDFKIKDIKVIHGFGDDENYWFLRDDIEVEIEVESNLDLEDVEIEWELYNEDYELIDDDSFSIDDLEEDEKEEYTFNVKLDSNIEDFENSELARLYVKITGEVDDKESIYNEDSSCDFDLEEVDIIIDKNFLILDNFKIIRDFSFGDEEDFDDILYSENIECGEEIIINAEIWNIGDDEQKDYYVEIYSSTLGLNKRIEFDSLDSFDSQEISLTFKIPEGLKEGQHKILFEVYDEDNDLYENSEDGEAKFSKYLVIKGNCVTIKPTISAEKINYDVLAGNEIVVKTKITNNGKDEVSYTLMPEGFEDWADLTNIGATVINLKSEESAEVEFVFKIKEDVEGEKEFNIIAYQGTDAVQTQMFSVNVEGKALTLKEKVLEFVSTERNQLIGIILLNVILIVAIIAVSVKILKKK